MHKYLKKIPLYIIYSILFGVFISNPVFADTVDYNVNVAPSLKLTIPSSSIVLNLNPPTKTFDSEDFTVEVGTNNQTGYTLTLSTPNDDTFLNRDSSSDGVSAKLYTLDTGTYTETTFTPDKWGYSINSNTAIPSTITSGFVPFQSGNTLMESSTAVNHDETELTFAAKIDYLQPAGSYATDLIFNLVANPLVNYMQDLDPSLCTTTPQTVVDKRDNQEYIIQRLQDGNCWMMTNLNLGAIDLTTDLTSENTNLSTTITAAGFNGWKKTTGTQTYLAGEYIPVPGDGSPSGTPYGTLYNYCAISAGTICTNSYSGNVQYDICPAGWRLPTGGPSGEFQNLYNQPAYNDYVKMRASIADGGAAFNLAGTFYNTPAVNVGDGGDYASSTMASSTNVYLFGIRPTSVIPYYDYARTFGRSVRCILNETMQNFNSSSMAAGEVRSLMDTRDGKKYKVAKLADGQVWMVSNLNLAGGTTLNASDSDVPTDNYYTLPASSSSGFSSETTAYVYNTGNETTTQTSSANNSYYSWLAAVAGNQTGVSGNGNDAPYSICPKGWRLPKSGDQSETSATSTTGYKKGDFYKLATAYGANLESSYYQNSAVFYNNAGPGNLPNLLLAGYYDSSTFYYGGAGGFYWSSSSNSSTRAYNLNFDTSHMSSADNSGRRNGLSVRCVAK